MSGVAIGRDRGFERGDVDLEPIGDGNLAKAREAEPEQSYALVDRVVGFVRPVQHQARTAGEPVRIHVEPGPGMPRHGQAHEIGHRTTAQQDAARVTRVAQHLLAPVDDLPLDVESGLVGTADVRIHGRGQQLGQHAQRCTGADDPAPETRVNVAQGVRQHELLELLVDRFRRLTVSRCLAGEVWPARRPVPVARPVGCGRPADSRACRPPSGGRAHASIPNPPDRATARLPEATRAHRFGGDLVATRNGLLHVDDDLIVSSGHGRAGPAANRR